MKRNLGFRFSVVRLKEKRSCRYVALGSHRGKREDRHLVFMHAGDPVSSIHFQGKYPSP